MPTVSERSARRLWGVWLSDRVRVTTLGGCNAEVRHFDNIAAGTAASSEAQSRARRGRLHGRQRLALFVHPPQCRVNLGQKLGQAKRIALRHRLASLPLLLELVC